MVEEHDPVNRDTEGELRRIREAAAFLLDKAKDGGLADLTSAVQRASEVLKLPLDLDRSNAELKKLALEQAKLDRENQMAARRERSERLGTVISLITPLLSVIALAATLSFQTWQFRQTEAARREAADEAAWKGAMDVLSKSGQVSPEVLAIEPFLNSAKHADEARRAVVRLLANATDTTMFDDLFSGLFVPVDWSNIGQVLRLDRALASKAVTLYEKSWNPDQQTNDFSKLSDSEVKTYNYVSYVAPKLCTAVGSVLKSSRPSGQSLDLSGTLFLNCDWSGANLHEADIANILLRRVDLKDTDLGAIASFDGADFHGTAWWEAKQLNGPLVQFLRTKFPCDPHMTYGVKSRKFSQKQCAEANENRSS